MYDHKDEGEYVSEDENDDINAIKSKFSSLVETLHETNQNLVTFEVLQEHYRNALKNVPASDLTLQNETQVNSGQDVDIVNLLKDICGSVNELKTEIGNSSQSGKDDISELEKKLKYPQKFLELSERSSKIEAECGFYKNQCHNFEEKYMQERDRVGHLEDLLSSKDNEIKSKESALRDKTDKLVKLNLQIKEADLFTKKIEKENATLREELAEYKKQLELASKANARLIEHAENTKTDDEKERLGTHISNHDLDNIKDQGTLSDLEIDLDALGQSARSTLSSKSAEGGFEQKYKEIKESKHRLKQKTKQLLRQYRGKRSQLEKKEVQLSSQRAGLLKLQTLHQSVEANHYIVIHHLGQQIQQTATLVSTIWPGDDLSCLERVDASDKLSEWIIRVDALSAWTISKLVKVSMNRRDRKMTDVNVPEIEDFSERRHSVRAAAMNCELEGKTVDHLISRLTDDNDAEESENGCQEN